MNPEQSKVRKIYTELSRKSFSFVGCWIVIGLVMFLHLGYNMVPVQLLLDEWDGNIIPFWMTITGVAIGNLRIYPFEGYTENAKKRKFSEMLRYYPIDRKEVKKMKLFYVVRIMAKVSVVSLFVQLYFTHIEDSIQGISWENFVYVFLMSFVVPVAWNAVYIHFEK
ncbi:MAG: hypothetical protein IJE49_03000 [Agathobacter sp.]|nr:hypothetical protein [Agathobacter sp.]